MNGVRFGMFVGALAALGVSVAASAATFTEGNLAGGTWSDVQGQAFGPGIEPTPAPGLTAGDPVYLTAFQMMRSDVGYGDPDADVYLAIMPAAFYDWGSSPLVTDAVGVSANAINPSTLASGDAMVFTFGTGLALSYDGVYSATYVTIGGGGELTPITVGSLIADFAEVEPGVWKPSPNYGGEGNYDATALFADGDANGYQEGCGYACDSSFQASFSTTPVPEPGSMMMLAVGGAGSYLVRRRRVSKS